MPSSIDRPVNVEGCKHSTSAHVTRSTNIGDLNRTPLGTKKRPLVRHRDPCHGKVKDRQGRPQFGLESGSEYHPLSSPVIGSNSKSGTRPPTRDARQTAVAPAESSSPPEYSARLPSPVSPKDSMLLMLQKRKRLPTVRAPTVWRWGTGEATEGGVLAFFRA